MGIVAREHVGGPLMDDANVGLERSIRSSGSIDHWVLRGNAERQTEQLIALLREVNPHESRRYEAFAHHIGNRRSRARRLLFALLVAAYASIAAVFLALAVFAFSAGGSTSQVLVAGLGSFLAGVLGGAYFYVVKRQVERRRQKQNEFRLAAKKWRTQVERTVALDDLD